MSSIAVAGAACEFPGAHSLDELWCNVLAQRAAFRAIPPQRLNLDDYASGAAEDADAISVRVAALIADYSFPRERFRIPASTYRQVDLAHWLALDVAARAIEGAQRRTGPLPAERTAVIVANTLTGEMSRATVMRHRWPYVRRVVADALRDRGAGTAADDSLLAAIERGFKAPFPPAGDESLAGSLSNTIAGRIANAFDFGGGAYAVDGACASSLVAIANACTSLEAGEVDAVVVGAVDVSLDPFELVGFSRLGALAVDDMRVYSRRPSGFLPGEGAAFVVLRRDDAVPSLATIRGWALSSDGAGGITRPELEGQLRVLHRAYARAGCDPGDVTYFEGHGTGTAIGDEVELTALQRLRGDQPQAPAYVGSVKTLVGHTKAAAGMAGLLKVLMALRREIVPPHALSGDQHPALGTTLRVARSATPWPADRSLIAGVSAFGFGGINAHLVVERDGPRRHTALARREERQSRTPQDAELVLVGAPDRDALAARLAQVAAELATMSRAELTDYAVRSAHEARDEDHRAALIVDRPWAAAEPLGTLARGLAGGAFADHAAGAYYGHERRTPRIALLFPGQAAAVRFDAGALGRRFPRLGDEFSACTHGDPESTAVAQPAIVAASLAGLDALRMMGVEADVALGHSLGELVALHWAGALDRASLRALARDRGAIMEASCARGSMAALGVDAASAARLLRGEAVVACDNGPNRCVVAGSADDVAATLAAARDAGVSGARVAVTTAFHSPLIEPAREPFRRALARHQIGAPQRSLVSTVLGRAWSAGDDVAATLVDQLAAPVRFSGALSALGAADLAIESGAGDTMRALVAHANGPPVVSLDVGGESVRGLLAVAAFAYVRTGDAAAARALAAGRFVRPVVSGARRTFFANPCGTNADTATPVPREARATAAATTPAIEPAAAADARALDIVRELVARRIELPVDTVVSETRLLDDLHLSSLAVGQMLADLANAFDVDLPADHLSFVSASVGELAAAFERYRAEGRTVRASVVEGVAPWVRRYAYADVALAKAPPAEGAHNWTYRSYERGSFDDALRRVLGPVSGAPKAYAVHFTDAEPATVAARLFRFAHEVALDPYATRALFVLHDAAGASFARSFALEHPRLPVFVALVAGEAPPEHVLVDLVNEASTSSGYTERIVRGGQRFARELRVADECAAGADALGGADVLLVSGGGKGIAAECAFERALETGAALILLGRSVPESDDALARNLARFERAGVRFRYVAADVCDRAAVRGAVADARAALGDVTAILHGAGVNAPAPIAALAFADVEDAIAVKVGGLENLVAACHVERLREIVAFGSIIAHSGMHGEAHYALANELLARRADAFAEALPSCRVITVSWSIWSGVGMGERLGRVDGLARIGVAAIPPDRGIAAYLALARDPHARGDIVIGGRLGGLPTLRLATNDLPLGRFLERTHVFFPRTELVVDAMLSRGSDPYLDDHLIDGLAVVPGVVLIEAMAQAATALLGLPPSEASEIVFARPVILGDDERRTIRIAALRESDDVRIEIRSDDSAFGFVHASARMRCALRVSPPAVRPEELSPGSVPSAAEVYGSILFHRGRFARIRAYRSVEARRCVAVAGSTTQTPWFAAAFPQRTLFGDPAVRDMAIHAIQACVPHERVLPAGIARVTRYAAAVPDELIIDAREVAHDAGGYVFDVALRDAMGRVVEEIVGLELRRSSSAPRAVPASLVATAVERRLLDAGLDGFSVRGFIPPSNERWEARTDGRPADGSVSRCYARGIELRCATGDAAGIDAEFADEIDPAGWHAVTARYRDAERCASTMLSGEPAVLAQARIWCALEAAKKAESATPVQLAVRAVRGDGITIFTTGASDVATLTVATTAGSAPLVVALAYAASATRVTGLAS